mmetsp:Transcript_22415/g.34674  ORF Transcript_22415/g.34674 Transcript_22415/m.34674 type:complete len:119 (+) Transcript_22415:295-651(+)
MDILLLFIDTATTLVSIVFPSGLVLVLAGFFFIVLPTTLQVIGIGFGAVFTAFTFGLGADTLFSLLQGSSEMEDGWFYKLLSLQEQNVETIFGLDFSSYFGTSLMEALVEDFWMHLSV